MAEILQAIVIDNGSALSKAGFAGKTTPSVVIPTLSKEGQSFIQRGEVVNWDDMEKMWHHMFHSELKVAPKDFGVLLTESVLQPKEARETATQIMFEKFSVPALYLCNSGSLSFFAAGKLTGIALESGDGVTQVVPVYNGQVVPEGVAKYNLGGSDLDKVMLDMLKKRGVELDLVNAKQCKATLGYVALSLEQELKKPASSFEKSFQLPDGHTITVGVERFECPEAMYQPKLMGRQEIGVSEMISTSMQKCSAAVRKTIVLGGGNTMFEGMVQRLNKEFEGVEVVGAAKYSAWVGGSILASLPTFQPLWITKKDYEEHGASIVQKKCK